VLAAGVGRQGQRGRPIDAYKDVGIRSLQRKYGSDCFTSSVITKLKQVATGRQKRVMWDAAQEFSEYLGLFTRGVENLPQVAVRMESGQKRPGFDGLSSVVWARPAP
jgi:hypothetical protein